MYAGKYCLRSKYYSRACKICAMTQGSITSTDRKKKLLFLRINKIKQLFKIALMMVNTEKLWLIFYTVVLFYCQKVEHKEKQCHFVMASLC